MTSPLRKNHPTTRPITRKKDLNWRALAAGCLAAGLIGNSLFAAPTSSNTADTSISGSSKNLVWRAKRFESDAPPRTAQPAVARPAVAQPSKPQTAIAPATRPEMAHVQRSQSAATRPAPRPQAKIRPANGKPPAAYEPVTAPAAEVAPAPKFSKNTPNLRSSSEPSRVMATALIEPPAELPAVAEASDATEATPEAAPTYAPSPVRVQTQAARRAELFAQAPSFPARPPARLEPNLSQMPNSPSLEVDCDAERAKLKPISALTASIVIEPGDMPPECGPRPETFEPRAWDLTTYTWKASNLCHKPLYFEEVRLERYGHALPPPLQPLASGAVFFANVAVLPYKMGVSLPNECIYTLGYYRPGSCAPYHIPGVPISARGALFEGAVIGGVVGAWPAPLPPPFGP